MRTTGYLAIAILMLSGCGKDQPVPVFTMSYVSDFTLHAGLNTFETHFYRTAIQSLYQPLLSNSGYTSNEIVSITPRYAELSTVFADEDIRFIRQVFVRIYDLSDPLNINSEIFYLDPVPSNVRRIIRPFPGLANVKDFASAPAFGIEVGISLWEITPRSFDMRLQFELNANVE